MDSAASEAEKALHQDFLYGLYRTYCTGTGQHNHSSILTKNGVTCFQMEPFGCV